MYLQLAANVLGLEPWNTIGLTHEPTHHVTTESPGRGLEALLRRKDAWDLVAVVLDFANDCEAVQ